MAFQAPQSTDKLNSPDHAFSHRVFVNDNASPEQAVTADASGNIVIAAALSLSGLTTGSVLFAGASGLISENNSGLYYDNSDGGSFALGDNSHMNNIFQAVKDESTSTVASVKSLVVARNKNTTNDNWVGFSWQTFDVAGNIASGARIMTQFTSHADSAVSGDMVFDTRNAGSRTEKMRILANGYVGIGTNSPGSLLHLYKAGAPRVKIDSATDGYPGLEIAEAGNTKWTLYNDNNNKLIFSDGTARMSFDGGNVGIGTTDPKNKLDISGDLRMGTETGTANLIISRGDAGETNYRDFKVIANTFEVKTASAHESASSVSRLFINYTTGNIGIGTTSPDRILGIGGLVARNIGMERGTVANTAGFNLTVNAGGATSAATNKAGGGLILQSGIATGDGGSEIKLQVAQASQGAGTADRSPTTVVKIDNTKSTLIGDGGTTNYIKFASDGELELYGTARVKRHTRVGAGSWCAGASAPTQGCEGAFMYLEFDNSTDDEAYYVLPIPARWDNTTDIEFSIDWYYTGTQDNGTVCWALEYKSIKDGEAIAGGTTTIAQTSAGNHTTGQMVRTTFTTKLLAVNLERGDTIGLRVFRDVDGGNDNGDTLVANARGINTHFRFIMNRLGDAV